MIIKKVELSEFRNYAQQSIDTEPGINVFYGDNAQGKTNILEAVYLCACARSHRTARDADLIRHSSDHYIVRINFINQNGSEDEIEIEYLDAVPGDPQRTRSQRIVRQNGLRLEKIGDLMGLFHAVIFAPEDLMLIKEGPSARRRYLDLLISQVRPSYFLNLQQYSRYLLQRNKLLKQMESFNDKNRLQLEVWNQVMAEQAAGLIEQRMIYTRRIAELAADAQEKISAGREKLFIKYRTVAGIKPDFTKKQIADHYLEKLNASMSDDLDKRTTGLGPHRDDLELSLDGDGLKPFASQGQQRSAVLALKLAELAILRQDTGEAPVLLLDDVMSELDERRRERLLENIHDAQVFVTCTDARQVVSEIRQEKQLDHEAESNAQLLTFFHVTQGQVIKLDK